MRYRYQFSKIYLNHALFLDRFLKTEFQTARIKRDARVRGVREKIHNFFIQSKVVLKIRIYNRGKDGLSEKFLKIYLDHALFFNRFLKDRVSSMVNLC